jgi:Ca-activated chloride channel family protein
MTACIHLERMMHRSSIAVSGESAAGYTLLKLIPSGLAAAARPLGLNLALALDVSGSMYEEDGTGVSRLQRVQDAALAAIQKLRPDDTLAVIGFAHDARVLLPPTPLSDRGRIEDVLRRVDSFDVDPGGTAMDEALALAVAEVEKHAGPGKLSQVVVLTDGETSGEQNCRTLARQAADRKVRLTLMGVGLDWKAALLKDLAGLGQGTWYYIDAAEAREATRIFAEEFETLTATALTEVELRIRPVKDVRVKRVRQVVPEIREVPLEEPEERNLVARLGTLRHDASSRYVLDLSLPRRPDGKYVVAHVEVSYDPGTGRRESSGAVPLEMSYSATGQGHVNAEVMKHIDDIQFKEMSDRWQKAVEGNDREAAVQAAREMARKGELMGNRAKKKTMLATQALQELNAEGRPSRKTQLAIEDASRLAEMP